MFKQNFKRTEAMFNSYPSSLCINTSSKAFGQLSPVSAQNLTLYGNLLSLHCSGASWMVSTAMFDVYPKLITYLFQSCPNKSCSIVTAKATSHWDFFFPIRLWLLHLHLVY